MKSGEGRDPGFHERRRLVRDPLELSGLSEADRLKIEEYNLLVRPITQGLTNYLDNPQLPEEDVRRDAAWIVEQVGGRIALAVVREIQNDSNLAKIVELAQRRAEIAGEPLAANIYPTGEAIQNAGFSSADSMYNSAVTNASVIYASGEFASMSRAEFISAVKRSVQLPVLWTLSGLAWQPAIMRGALEHWAVNLEGYGSAVESEGLLYDKAHRVVKLAKPLIGWRTQTAPTIGDIPTDDEPIGCPVSFEPKLVVRYYEHMVDVIERYQAWPDELTIR